MVTIDAVDPSRDVRDRVAAGAGISEPLDKIWFHKLAAAVVDAGRCVRCGTCIAACPSSSIGVAADGLPTLVRMCTGCSSCWDFCPLGGLRTERLQQICTSADDQARCSPVDGNGPSSAPSAVVEPINGSGTAWKARSDAGNVDDSAADWSFGGLGQVRAAYEARALKPIGGAQDGGVVTALLAALLRQGYIQGTLISGKHGPLNGESLLATTPDQVHQAAGNVYDQTHPLGKLARGLPQGIDEIALVGTPCQVAGVRALQLFPWRYRSVPADKVKLTIALFCTRSFDSLRLTRELIRQGLDLSRLAKVDIRDGWFHGYDADGRVILETKVSTLRRAGLRGCDECADFTGAMADIAVGNVGSRRGYTTVLIRTTRGAEAWEQARGALEMAPLPDPAAVAASAARNRARALRALRREFGGERFLWVRYSEHLAAYLGTDRAPSTPPSHRSHHYTVSC